LDYLQNSQISKEIRIPLQETKASKIILKKSLKSFKKINVLGQRLLVDLDEAQKWDQFSIEILLKDTKGIDSFLTGFNTF
jgi:hypothetical protein